MIKIVLYSLNEILDKKHPLPHLPPQRVPKQPGTQAPLEQRKLQSPQLAHTQGKTLQGDFPPAHPRRTKTQSQVLQRSHCQFVHPQGFLLRTAQEDLHPTGRG